jgi:riboflavin kinase / FMN adenylyltransferase
LRTSGRSGVDRLFCARFDARLAALSPQDFIREYLVDGLGTRYLAIGDDFRFGRNRAGDFGTLKAAGAEYGFEVADTPSCMLDGIRVSSTAVRAALAAGDLALAARLLGRHYAMSRPRAGGAPAGAHARLSRPSTCARGAGRSR